MAKLKLNILVDGIRCRTLEDVRENFNGLDLLEYLNSGYLEKWLKSRNYNEELEKINNLKNKNTYEKLKGLAEIFGVEVDEDTLKEEAKIYDIQHNKDKNEQDTTNKKEENNKEIHKKNNLLKKLILEVNFFIDIPKNTETEDTFISNLNEFITSIIENSIDNFCNENFSFVVKLSSNTSSKGIFFINNDEIKMNEKKDFFDIKDSFISNLRDINNSFFKEWKEIKSLNKFKNLEALKKFTYSFKFDLPNYYCRGIYLNNLPDNLLERIKNKIEKIEQELNSYFKNTNDFAFMDFEGNVQKDDFIIIVDNFKNDFLTAECIIKNIVEISEIDLVKEYL